MYIMGIYLITLFRNLNKITIDYDKICGGAFKVCRVPFTLTKDFAKPLYFFI